MNLVEDFDNLRSGLSLFDSTNERLNEDQFEASFSAYAAPGVSSAQESAPSSSARPLLSVDTTVKQTSRGRGHVVNVACANDNVLVATSRCFLIRYFWDEYGNEKVVEVEVVRGQDCRIVGLFVDPTASHVLVCVRVQGTHELHYLHRRWSKSRPLSKLRGVNVTAVAWQPPGSLDGSGGDLAGGSSGGGDEGGAITSDEPFLSDTCTGVVLLGTDQGTILELVVDERAGSKKEPAPKQLLQLPALAAAGAAPGAAGTSGTSAERLRSIHSLYQYRVRGHRGWLVLAATRAHLYALTGGPSREALFAAHPSPAPVLEAMTPFSNSQLHIYMGEPASATLSATHTSPSATRFAWLVGSMVYHGDLDLEGCLDGGAPLPSINALPLGDGPGAPAAATAAATLSGNLSGGGGSGAPATAGAGTSSASGGGGATAVIGSAFAGSGAAAAAAAAAGGLRPSSPSPSGAGPSSPHGTLGTLSDPGDVYPHALVMTDWHFIVLWNDRVLAVNRVSGRVVAEVGFRSALTLRSVSGEATWALDGLVRDCSGSGTMYMYSDEVLYEVTVAQEGRDMWRVYMGLQDWESALKHCSSPSQRDEVHRAHAESAMASGDLATAARHFAKVVGGWPPFEDIALKFVESEAPDALQLFLTTKLGVLGRADRAQSTLVGAWLTELLLDKISREVLEAGGQPSSRVAAAEEALRSFLVEQVEVLDPGTTGGLLAAYGRLEDLVAFAAARGDHEAVLEHLVQHPSGAVRALTVLRKPSCSRELIYKFAPALVAAATEQMVDFYITAKPPLDARRLIPALLRFGEPGAPQEQRAHVLRYVEFAIDQLNCQDSAVHNLAVALLSLSPGEASLLSYLGRGRDAGGRPLYDPKYALRLVQERGKERATVKLLCELGMYEDAVGLALHQGDLDLAKSVAGMPPEEEEAVRRRLWLAVAKHLVQGGGSGPQAQQDQAAAIKQAVEFLKEAGGLLKIEDILPFFPDFVTIDNFKDAICDSLERYNRQIEDLRREMGEATDIADAVRRDLKLLSARTAVLEGGEPCARCGRPVALELPPPSTLPPGLPHVGAVQPLFLFPSGLVYHGACCVAEVWELAHPQQRQRLAGTLSKAARLQQVQQRLRVGGGPADEAVKAALTALGAEVAAEDPRNGEITIRMVDMPFVTEADADQATSWLI